jgi:hypothetical protein
MSVCHEKNVRAQSCHLLYLWQLLLANDPDDACVSAVGDVGGSVCLYIYTVAKPQVGPSVDYVQHDDPCTDRLVSLHAGEIQFWRDTGGGGHTHYSYCAAAERHFCGEHDRYTEELIFKLIVLTNAEE